MSLSDKPGIGCAKPQLVRGKLFFTRSKTHQIDIGNNGIARSDLEPYSDKNS